jgi:hypothetical protein
VASGASRQTLTASSRPERCLDAFNDGIKPALVRGRINQREAVDQAAIAAEHHLLVEGLAADRFLKPGFSLPAQLRGFHP